MIAVSISSTKADVYLFNAAGSGNTFGAAGYSTADITIWHQYALVVTYSSPNTTATMYADGNATAKGTETKNFNRSGTGTGTAYIGFDNAVGDRYANGYIDEFRIHSTVMNATNVANLYNNNDSSDIDKYLVSYYSFNQDTIRTKMDETYIDNNVLDTPIFNT